MEKHIPVLLKETIEGLNIKKDGIYVDLTLGRGGHSREILKRLHHGTLIGVDQDEEAIRESKENLKTSDSQVIIVKSNFVKLNEILKTLKIDKVDGIMMDLGVSSPQFDEEERGFSYRKDSVLDMRMDRDQVLTAKTIINEYSIEDLCKIFREYGDERFAYPIAKNIIKARTNNPVSTTSELVEIIKKSKPAKELAKSGHPAKQVFQALRIAVNDELNVLTKTLGEAVEALKVGGRLAVITFHSGEDRIVKNIFNELTKVEGNRLNLPDAPLEIHYALINRHPIAPSEEEVAINHRSKSAKLRIIERI